MTVAQNLAHTAAIADARLKRNIAFLHAAESPATQLVTDPGNEIPALLRIAGFARQYRHAVHELRRAEQGWRNFVALNSADDPAADEHPHKIAGLRYQVAATAKALDQALTEIELSIDLKKAVL